MSQQQQGAEQAPDLNNELQTRREKLSALRDNGNAFPNDLSTFANQAYQMNVLKKSFFQSMMAA